MWGDGRHQICKCEAPRSNWLSKTRTSSEGSNGFPNVLFTLSADFQDLSVQ